MVRRKPGEESEMKHTTFAVDIAKNVFEIAVSYEPGIVREYHRVTRAKFVEFFAKQESGTVVMEACSSAHFWARELEKLGHRAVLLPPHAVRPYVQRNKTDRADSKGMLEASRNKHSQAGDTTALLTDCHEPLNNDRKVNADARGHPEDLAMK